VCEAPTLEAILEHLRRAPEAADVAVWESRGGGDVVVAVVRPDGVLIEVPAGTAGPGAAARQGGPSALTTRGEVAARLATALAGAVATADLAFDVPEIVRQALMVADALLTALDG
jgi:hypothetical protein